MLFGSNAQQLRGRPAVHINGRMNLDAVYGAAIPLGDTFQHAGFVKLIAINLADQRDFVQRSHKRHSSAIMSSVRSIGRHSNGILIVLHSSSTISIVMLSSAPSDHGGVMTFPLRTKSTHDPIASATRPGHVEIPVSRTVGLLTPGMFFVLLVGLPALRSLTGSSGVALFDAFYRSGALVFGGGHVVCCRFSARPSSRLVG